ncbi:hypothetical protein BXP70_21880 [Hymenobacter crusticola]|uniref:Uncharacterized protein n=1 Tax=Hymenobacter crusticola TaxID=1770526 RepID=A0A243WAN5_9BACT|nr:hypothetical protein BXP70_21880 [Hymenobacter crusticola]
MHLGSQQLFSAQLAFLLRFVLLLHALFSGMYFPYVWQFTAEDATRTLRYLNLCFQGRSTLLRSYQKAWPY